MRFRGTHDHNLDAKNRLTVPSKLRVQFADRLVIAKSVDPCLALWSEDAYDAMVETALAKLNPQSPEKRRMDRFYNAYAQATEIDAAGRVMIPGFLMEAAELGREVVLSGAGDRLEIWDRAFWNTEDAAITAGIQDLTANLGHAG